MIENRRLEVLFRAHYCNMIRLATAYLTDADDAEDVVQDIFVRLLEKEVQMSEEKTAAYLMTAVRNGCYNIIRRKLLKEQIAGLYPIETKEEMVPIETLIERLEEVSAYIENRITEPHATILRMRFDENMTLKEIAGKLNMNINTVYKYLQQSIRQLRTHFKEY